MKFPWIKKKEDTSVPPIILTKHEHLWQDFPWYIDFNWDTYDYSVQIVEPYVCAYCRERKNIILDVRKGHSDRPGKVVSAIISTWENEFKRHIKPKAEVEDMINDFQHIDKVGLSYFHMLHDSKNPSTSWKSKTDNKDIKLSL